MPGTWPVPPGAIIQVQHGGNCRRLRLPGNRYAFETPQFANDFRRVDLCFRGAVFVRAAGGGRLARE